MTHPDTLTIPRAVVEQVLNAMLGVVYGDPVFGDKAKSAITSLRAALQPQACVSKPAESDTQDSLCVKDGGLQAAAEPLGFTEETRVGSEFLDGPVDQEGTKVLGVRVQEDTVIIKMKGGKRWGNQWARELCHKLLTDREPGGNPNAFNKWS